MKKLLFIFFFLFPVLSFATHERAGEITYKHRPDLGKYHYEITVTTYTKGSSTAADRCSLYVDPGDGSGEKLVCRSNGTSGPDFWGANCQFNQNCPGGLMGEWNIGSPTLQSLDVKKNIYTFIHSYPGQGTYIISMTDPNRNDGIVNVGTGVPFSIQDTLRINDWMGANNSPVLVNPPIDKACIGKVFIHNPGAVDPDGDSLSYQLGVCFQGRDTPVTGYFIPNGVTVDPFTGDFIWNAPVLLGPPYQLCYEYNFAIDIVEWRKFMGTWHKIGTVRRDMQVTVCDCNNVGPVISNVKDTCIEANTTLTFTITAVDPDNNAIQTFTATGGPFNLIPQATFTTTTIPSPTVTGTFSWTPSCNQVRKAPYLVTFKATDDGSPDIPPNILSDYESILIRVIAPAPKNLTATPNCTRMELTWDGSGVCKPSANPHIGYKIYRKVSCDTFSPGYCQTGMPPSWGYTLIASVGPNVTYFSDDNGGMGLASGYIYSYRVCAYYFDGAESYISNPVCAKLVRDVPIITNVDVISTGSNGQINVKWLKPLANPSNYDTTIISNHGPYRFDLLRAQGYVPPSTFSLIQSFSSPYFATLNTTSYSDIGLNTQTTPYTYHIDFYDTIPQNCSAPNASSVFISCVPNDNQLKLTWNEQVPWNNYRYDVYRFNGSAWDSIGSTVAQTFTDTGLVNGGTYCYKVKSIGAYPDTSLPAPLINWSQELCCQPQDMTAPCPLTLTIDSLCEEFRNLLSWNNPNNTCSDDAVYYILYHTPTNNNDFSVLDTISPVTTTFFLHDSLLSVAGCYAVTAVDSFGNQSSFSNVICVDNCPLYQLPNVFTPNGDNQNDFFTPLIPYRYVKEIDIKIYNRWGTEVFRTTDPKIMWDGKSQQTKMLCSDGVYYYVCVVYYIRLKGMIPHVLTGNVHLLSR